MTDRNFLRLTYLAFKSGANLRTEDVRRLLAERGVSISNNRLRELGRDSDRGVPITAAELYELISAWAAEQRGVDQFEIT